MYHKGIKMKKNNLKETLKQEIELEASALERRVNTKKSLTSVEMPEDSYEDLMERIRVKREQKLESESKSSRKIIPFRVRRKALATVAMVAVLVVGVGLGANGARLYILNVNNRDQNDGLDIIAGTDDVFYVELTEKEAYEKIEEDIGILALRLTDRPQELKLEKVYIDIESKEALMEFYYDNHVLTIYEIKNNNVSFNALQDGKIVDTMDTFHLGETLDIIEIDKGNDESFYTIQLKRGNAFYDISSDMELEEFKKILFGIIFNND